MVPWASIHTNQANLKRWLNVGLLLGQRCLLKGALQVRRFVILKKSIYQALNWILDVNNTIYVEIIPPRLTIGPVIIYVF